MPRPEQYRSSYPRGGSIALLCEGDVAGYEVNLLQPWLDGRLINSPQVDVWTCGTSGAVYGVSDALGRSRPIVVVEDRDFRTPEEAMSDCRRSKSDREDRDVTVLAWRAWQRNEIENYLLEPKVVLSVFADAFGCSEAEVQEILEQVLPALAVFQAIEWALCRVRRDWRRTAPDGPLRSGLVISPVWDDIQKKATAPSFTAARDRLAANMAAWQRRAVGPGRVFCEENGRLLLNHLGAKYDEWRATDLASMAWSSEWSGKDVLQWLRIAVTSRKGWFNSVTRRFEPMSWGGLGRSERDGLDRPIEDALRRPLAKAFLSFLEDSPNTEVSKEWGDLADVCRAAFSSGSYRRSG